MMSSLHDGRTPELLAPAGNWDCAHAAVASGADAIYFGLQSFNARMRADNFGLDDLPALMRMLHAHGVRGFVTMNTLIFPGELEAAALQLRRLEAAGVDAIIVQDLGLAWLARQIAPSLELHASTQMTVTSPEGLAFLDQLFSLDRVVLARELSLKEIGRFPQEAPLEVFVHGALCVAYSGQCLTSESLGQRSANRGECAQACRMTYELIVDGEPRDLGERRYLLSPQDLAAVDLIPALLAKGVVSFKIEGRLKSPDYVAAVTKIYRKAIDAALGAQETASAPEQAVTAHDRYSLEMTFSRGLSTGWLEGTNHPRLTHGKFGKKRGVCLGRISDVGPGWITLEVKPEVPLAVNDGVVFDAGEERDQEQGGRIWKLEKGPTPKLFFHRRSGIQWSRIQPGHQLWKTDDPALNKEIRQSWSGFTPDVPGRPIDIRVEGQAGAPLRLLCEGHEVVSSMILEVAESRPLQEEILRDKLGRLGGTEYTLGGLENAIEGDVMLPVSALNRLRRSLVERLDQAQKQRAEAAPQEEEVIPQLQALLPSMEEQPITPTKSTPESIILCRTKAQIEAALAFAPDVLYIDFEDIRRYKETVSWLRDERPGLTLVLATPRIQKAAEATFFKIIERAAPDGVLIRNLGAMSFFSHRDDLALIGDFSLNVANGLSARLLHEHTPLSRLTVSYDLNIAQVLSLLQSAPPSWFELTLHQHMPMFHMEHCVFCTFLSEGTSVKDCGRPCEAHEVYLKDRVGQLHRLHADVGCRNTLFNGRAQTGARHFKAFVEAGVRRFRIELLDETGAQATKILAAYQALLAGEADGSQLWRQLGALERLGVTEGTF